MNFFKEIFGQKMSKKIAYQYAAIVVALVFVGQLPNLDAPLGAAASRAMENIAGVVGMGAAVLPNETNRIAQELQSKETELNMRERAIDAKEREIRDVVLEETAKQNRLTLLVIAGITLCLVLLIGMNFYLDRKRGSAPIIPIDNKQKLGTHAHEGEFSTKL